jgi:hypothetical protein
MKRNGLTWQSNDCLPRTSKSQIWGKKIGREKLVTILVYLIQNILILIGAEYLSQDYVL